MGQSSVKFVSTMCQVKFKLRCDRTIKTTNIMRLMHWAGKIILHIFIIQICDIHVHICI